MNTKSLRALYFVFALIISATVFSSCGKNVIQSDGLDEVTSENETLTQIVTDDNGETKVVTVESTTLDKTTKNDEKTNKETKKTSSNIEKSTLKKNITLTSGLNSNDVSEVMEYYKLVAKKNASLKMKKNLSLVSLDCKQVLIDGKSDPEKLEIGMNVFDKAARLGLKIASGKTTFPGNPSALRVSDWKNAKAVNDGTYTTITVSVTPQKDGYNGKEFEGSCGRSMQVLAGFDTAMESLSMMTADFEHGDVSIEYQNPSIKLKVLNSTGELVENSCKWYYKTKINLNRLDATMKVMKMHDVHLEKSIGVIEYSVTY